MLQIHFVEILIGAEEIGNVGNPPLDLVLPTFSWTFSCTSNTLGWGGGYSNYPKITRNVQET